nr:MAG TPA: hypothetical protein [Inoviridae sp.]
MGNLFAHQSHQAQSVGKPVAHPTSYYLWRQAIATPNPAYPP